METKNSIIQTCAGALVDAANTILNTSKLLADNIDENMALIASMNVDVEALRAHTVLLQQKLDAYSG